MNRLFVQKYVLFPSIFFVWISCANNNTDGLSGNETITAIFNKEETADLQILLDLFSEKVCEFNDVQSASAADCYRNFMEYQKNEVSSGVMVMPLTIAEQQNMIDQISESTRNEIWETEILEGERFTTLNMSGKYMEFLEAFSNEDLVIYGYVKSLKEAGAISASAQSDMILFPEKYDVGDICIRLIIAIHYLTLNQ